MSAIEFVLESERVSQSMNAPRHDTQLKVAGLLLFDGQLLLIREQRIHESSPVWNIVRGTFDPLKDRSLVECLQREVAEETTFTIDETEELPTQFYLSGDKIRVISPYIVRLGALKPITPHAVREETILELRWIPVEHLHPILNWPDLVPHARETIQLFLTNQSATKRVQITTY